MRIKKLRGWRKKRRYAEIVDAFRRFERYVFRDDRIEPTGYVEDLWQKHIHSIEPVHEQPALVRIIDDPSVARTMEWTEARWNMDSLPKGVKRLDISGSFDDGEEDA